MSPRRKFEPTYEQADVLKKVRELSRRYDSFRKQYREQLELGRELEIPYKQLAKAARRNVGTIHKMLNRGLDDEGMDEVGESGIVGLDEGMDENAG